MKKSKKYLRWIKSLPCADCGRHGRSSAHHFKSDLHLSGVGMRAPDQITIPLCPSCHMKFHNKESKTWREDQRAWLIRTIHEALAVGALETGGDFSEI